MTNFTQNLSMQELNKRIEFILNANKDTSSKLQKICTLLHSEMPLYDWVGFYFANDDKGVLELKQFSGAVTEHTEIPFGKGICGQTAVNNQSMLVPDVTLSDNYLACSIDTKSELVVPLFKNGKNIGQIDIDSHTVDAFTENDKLFLEDLMTKISDII